MDEFGEFPGIYIWPKGHEEGNPFPEDFWERVEEAMRDAGIEWEKI